MSLHDQPPEAIPELTRRIARTSFPKGSLAMHLRDALARLYVHRVHCSSGRK